MVRRWIISTLLSLSGLLLLSSCVSPAGVQVAEDYVRESGFNPLAVLRIMQVSGSKSDSPAHFRIVFEPMTERGLLNASENVDEQVIKDLEQVCDFKTPSGVESRWVFTNVGQWRFLPVNSLALKDWNMLVPLTNEVKDCSMIDTQYRDWIKKVRKTAKIDGLASESNGTSISQLRFADRAFVLSGAEEHINLWDTLGFYEYSADNTKISTTGPAITDATWSIRLYNLLNTIDDDTNVVVSDVIYCNGSPCLKDKLLILVDDLDEFRPFVKKYASDDILFTEDAKVEGFGLSVSKREFNRLKKYE